MSPRHWDALECTLIFALFAVVAGQLPPDVNESHYLTKAKHFWDRSWCPDDLFLSSSFAHWLFYVTFGWMTKFISLPAFAWFGRILTWISLAFAWQRLSKSLFQVPQVPLFFSVLSAAMFQLLNERFHLAGEWVVGGFEAKGFAYAFVLLALAQAVNRKWELAWPLAGAAALFHVLVGGWALLALSFAFVWCSKPNQNHAGWASTIAKHVQENWISIVVCIGLITVAALPPLLSNQGATRDDAALAHSTYVNMRISHHLSFSAFSANRVARFSLMLVFGVYLYFWFQKESKILARRVQPLAWFAIGTLIVAYGGLLLSGFAEQGDSASLWAAGLLRFYWFRITDFGVPTALSLSCCLLLSRWLAFGPTLFHRRIPFFVAAVVAAATVVMAFENYTDPRPMADRSLPTYEDSPARTLGTWQNWKRVCNWIRSNTPKDAVFFTPADQQTFKWYAHRHEVVSWKDIPQDAFSIIEWRERIAMLYDPQLRFANGILQYTDQQLLDLANRYGATHLLVPQYQVDLTPGGTELNQVYPVDPNEKSTYAVFELDRLTDDSDTTD